MDFKTQPGPLVVYMETLLLYRTRGPGCVSENDMDSVLIIFSLVSIVTTISKEVNQARRVKLISKIADLTVSTLFFFRKSRKKSQK